jgi:hypothetical protein
MTDFTPQEMAEIETLTLTKKIAHGLKGALTAKTSRGAQYQSENHF